MASDSRLISDRVKQVEVEIGRHEMNLEKLKAELNELLIAARVVERLATGKPLQPALIKPALFEDALGETAQRPSMPEMIRETLELAELFDGEGLEPKQITTEIRKRYWPDCSGDRVNSIAWRMWKRGELEKDGSVYSLPKKNKASDDVAGEQASEAFDANPEHDREAGQGGGT